MRCTMVAGKSVCLLFIFLTLTCVFSHSWTPQNEGRKLFGGYTIVPKPCRPSLPSRIKSSQPAICMFNYECTRRNGEVVGACMDGFLFGACCQLPPKSTMNGNDEPPGTDELLHLHQVDHVPDIPILLNPDGTPVGMSVSPSSETTKTDKSNVSNGGETIYTKISSSNQNSSPTLSSPDIANNVEKMRLPEQADVSHLAEDFPALLGQQDIIDDLRLPGLLTHSDSNNDIQDHQDSSAVNPVTTLLSPDQILQIADPVDQLPALFSQGLGQNNHSDPDTILLNENGTLLEETNNPDEIFRPSTETPINKVTQDGSTWIKFSEQPTSSTMELTSTSQAPKSTSVITKVPLATQMYTNMQKITSNLPSTQLTMTSTFEKTSTIEKKMSTKLMTDSVMIEATTPMTATSMKDELVKVPTIIYDLPSGNKKKDDVLDKEEIAINHIISILNDTMPNSDAVSVTLPVPNYSPVQAWVSIDETSKPSHHVKVSSSNYRPTTPATSTFPYSFYKPGSIQPKPSSAYYNYELVPTETTYASHYSTSSGPYGSRPSTQSYSGASSNNFGYSSSRPTTNPPAPTVIVLGPLGTGYTTQATQKPVTRKPTGVTTKPASNTIKTTPVRPITLISTKKPSVTTTITHNISTVISNVANNNVVSTSYISVNLKEGTSARPIVDVSTEAIAAENTEDRPSTKKPVIWTTVSSWSSKPTFQLKPSTSSNWSNQNLTPINNLIFKDTANENTKTTTAIPCEDETAAPDDLINFPPVRNPNLNISMPISQQEKPTIVETYNNTGYPDIELISEHDIPTPTFVEDDVLTNKVDAFVNKLVESLQGTFVNLKDMVYTRNGTVENSTVPSTVTKRPTSGSTTTRRPTRKPTTKPSSSSATTKRPSATTKRPTRPTQKPSSSEKPTRPTKVTTSRPKPNISQNTTTKRPQVTTRRPKPTRKTTTAPTSSTEAILEEQSLNTTESSVAEMDAVADFRNQCGVRPLVSRAAKIVGGKGAQFGEWPWQVLVREATWLGLFTKNKCGGVLITDKYVITAAHCQPGFLASLVAVFGEYDISGELETKRSITKNVRRVIVNRGYDPATFENDLALLELESAVQFDEHIVPICMPEDGIDFTGRMATVTGWGRLKYNGGVPSVLQEVRVPIMENSVCQEMFQTGGHPKLILDSFLCAGYANGQKDSCEGDSGGPLVMEQPDGRWFLVGTVSHGIKCASPYLPGVYMRTTFFKPWLHSITGV